MKKQFSKNGFSLIELSLVIVIISFLLGGIISGRNILASANLKNAQSVTRSSPIRSIPDLSFWVETTLDGAITNSLSSTNLSNNDLVASWNDISGNKNNVIQATSANQPKYVTSGIGSLPSVQFNGSSTNLEFDGFALDAGYTVFMVFNAASVTGENQLLGISKSGNYGILIEINDAIFRVLHRAPVGVTGGNDNYSVSSATSNTNYIMAYTRNYDQSVVNVKLNNTSFISGVTGAVGAFDAVDLELVLGYLKAGNIRYFNGQMSEVIIFNRTLNDNEINIVQQYLSKKYGITLS